MDSPPVDLSALMRVAHRAASREGLCPSDAEDIASIALMHYLKSAPSVQHPIAWVFLVARRKAWLLRKRESNLRPESDYASEASLFSDRFCTIETDLDLKSALAALAPAERNAVLFRYVEGRPVEAIAKTLGVSATTVKRRLRSGRESLRRALTGQSLQRYIHLTNLGIAGER